MEALIVILIEALGTLIAPLFISFATMVGSALSSLFALGLDLLMFLMRGERRNTTVNRSGGTTQSTSTTPTTITSSEPSSHKQRPTRRWSRWLLFGSLGLTTSLLLLFIVINQWFLDDVARWILDKQQQKTGITITATAIKGNLFTGQFEATDITVQRLNHPAGVIDLTVRQLNTTISVWSVFSQPIIVPSLSVEEIRGRFERGVLGQAPKEKTQNSDGISIEQEDQNTTVTLDQTKKQKRAFIISTLSVSDLQVTYADYTRKRPLSVPVTLTQLSAIPLRSEWAVFDVLFCSNATGTIANRPFQISTSGNDLGRNTEWTATDLPINLLASQIGGPFAFLTSGTCDVQVTDHWRASSDKNIIVMDWKLMLHHVTAEVPATTSKTMSLLAKPVVAFINSQADQVPLSFRVEIDERRFHGTASAEAAGLWQVVGDSLAATLAKSLGIETDTVKEIGDKALDKAKDLLDKWRKK